MLLPYPKTGTARDDAEVISVITLRMDTRPDLFADENETWSSALPKRKARPVGIARVQKPNRRQLELRPSHLESLLPEGHRARIVWCYVERQDLTGLYAGTKAVEGRPDTGFIDDKNTEPLLN